MKPAILLATALALATGSDGVARAQMADPGTASDPVVAIVNGDELHRSDVVMLYQSLPQEYRQLPMTTLYPQLLNRLVDRKLAAQAARQEGLHDDDAVKRRMAFLGDRVLQERYLLVHIEVALTDERLRAAYDKMIAEQPAGDEVRARHILLKSEEEAKAVIAELAAGADFVETAKARSTGPSASRGGDLGYFGKDEMIQEFADAAFALQAGEITHEPVRTQFGWHVIKVEDRRSAAAPSFEASVEELQKTEAQAVIRELTAALRDKADIELFSPGGGSMPTTPAPGDTKTE